MVTGFELVTVLPNTTNAFVTTTTPFDSVALFTTTTRLDTLTMVEEDLDRTVVEDLDGGRRRRGSYGTD
ncbi:hypothetical protein Bca52824_027281 [Brassica carinata]|uniref:Uncharacterized protein n=1 Tax=Brassica carinata TaxID=52824 RepID=A0A8X7SJE2_BRACI|nr:hypothetical protein Bca52824_027281 [Brassica carinata]